MSLADKLRPHVEALKADAAHGNHKAEQVIRMYQMHCTCPNDPGAPVMCESYFGEWLKERQTKQQEAA